MPTETIHEAIQAYLVHLKSGGKKDRTLFTYGKDIELIETFFDGDKPLTSIRAMQVGRFIKSDRLRMLPKGQPRAKRTVDKTLRVLRMFLIWAETTGRLTEAPLPKDTPMGRSRRPTQEPHPESNLESNPESSFWESDDNGDAQG